MALSVGDAAPDFELPRTLAEGDTIKLSDYRGKKNVLLCFYPFDFSGVCSEQLPAYQAEKARFEGADCEVIGISVDSPFAQKQWKEKENLNFTLVSDFNRDVSKAYGAQFEELMGFSGVAKRAAFVIDKAGKVQYAEVLASPRDLPNFDKIQETLQGLS